MEAEKDKLHQYFNEKPVSGTSADFTKLVMDRVETIAETPFVIKPLISRKGWIYIVLIGLILVFGSFSLEFVGTLQKMPTLLTWPELNLEDFATSIKIAVVVVSLLLILTIADILYRKMKNLA
ncbi:MAG: hypothetical protein AB8B74_14330 [Crocinitomicaceae bacterium]